MFRSSHRQRYFHRQWEANDVVGRVSEGLFTFVSTLSECVYGLSDAFGGCTGSPSFLSECLLVSWSPLLVALGFLLLK